MSRSVPISVAILLAACGGVAATNGTNTADSQPQRRLQRPVRYVALAPSDATVRNFGEDGQASVDNEFRYAFHTEAAARQGFGAGVMNALASAGIRYVPAQRQFRDARRAYAPLIAIDRGGSTDVILAMNPIEAGEVSLCEACSSNLGLVHAGRVADLGAFDNNGYGAVGTVHLLTQSGPVIVVGVHTSFASQGESGDNASLVVIGEGGYLPDQIPLLRDSGAEVHASAPLLRRRVRLQGDRLVVLYPGSRPAQAVFRIGPSRLELIEGRVPAALTQLNP